MFDALGIDTQGHADQIFSSWDAGWRSLLLRRMTGHTDVEDATIAPVAEQTIVLVTRGACDVESSAGGRWARAQYRPGRIGMTAPNRPTRLRWRTTSPTPHETLQLFLPAAATARLIEEVWDRDPARVALPDTLATDDPLLEHVMLDLLRAAEDGIGDVYAEAAAAFIAVHVLTRHGGLAAPRPRAGDDARIRRVRSFLRENLHLPLSLAEIAAEACMSPYHFVRVFRDHTGETPYRHLTRLRIERSQHELARGRAPIGEIARGCGFSSSTHFATTFRRQIGCTPTEYRRVHDYSAQHPREPARTRERSATS